MFRSVLAATALALSTAAATITPLPAQATGHGCQTVRFPSGAYAHSVYGSAVSHASQCYSLAVRPGQQARVRILYGNVFFTTTHTNGAYNDVQFYTANGQLFVYVHTDFAGPQPFSIEFVFV